MIAAALCALLLLIHLASCAHVAARARRDSRSCGTRPHCDAVVLRPVCGYDFRQVDTLSSGLPLRNGTRVIFCVEDARDSCMASVAEAVLRSRGTARAMVGAGSLDSNPKMNNLQKGWEASTEELVVMTDANVLIPYNYVNLMYAPMARDLRVGAVSAPPVGSDPDGAVGELECALMNTYQARWQMLGDALGVGYAHGKNMMIRRSTLEAAGGLLAMCAMPGEDTALTAALGRLGYRVALTSPLPQPVGRRRLSEVLDRQLRWARLRRAMLPRYYALEVLSTGVAPIAAACVAGLQGYPAWLPAAVAAAYYGAEGLTAWAAGWHVSLRYVALLPVRDALLHAIHLLASPRDSVTWRGRTTPLKSSKGNV